jgi:metallophosphoesterase superfamily enzyme
MRVILDANVVVAAFASRGLCESILELIAVTADVHLGIRDDHPERYSALENIFKQIEAENIKTLLIAGDLFDKDFRNYSEFEKLCRKYPEVQLEHPHLYCPHHHGD